MEDVTNCVSILVSGNDRNILLSDSDTGVDTGSRKILGILKGVVNG